MLDKPAGVARETPPPRGGPAMAVPPRPPPGGATGWTPVNFCPRFVAGGWFWLRVRPSSPCWRCWR